MVNFKISTLIFIIFSLLLLSCGKDDDDKKDTTLKNHIKVGSESSELINGYIEPGGTDTDASGNEVRFYDVYLTTKDLTVNDDGDFVGNGDMVEMKLVSNSANELAAGTYTIGSGILNSVMWYYKNYDDASETWYLSVTGTITVTKVTAGYKIVIDIKMMDDNAVFSDAKGQFEGALTEID